MTVIAILGSGMAAFGAGHAVTQRRLSLVDVRQARMARRPHRDLRRSGDGFVFDDGPHVSFTKDERIQDLLAGNVDQEYETSPAQVNNHWQGHWIKHPAQCNLHGLPTDLVVAVIKDFVAASRRRDDGRSRNYADWLRRRVRRHVRGDVPDGVHDQVPHDDRGQHDHRLARAADVPAEARGGAPRRARADDAQTSTTSRRSAIRATAASSRTSAASSSNADVRARITRSSAIDPAGVDGARFANGSTTATTTA